VDTALAEFDFRRATGAVWSIVEDANRYIEKERPWELARDGDPRLDGVLAALVGTCLGLGSALEAFIPALAARVRTQCTPVDGVLPPPSPLFPRLEPVP
jgi:methionyl-tRNA synthetase